MIDGYDSGEGGSNEPWEAIRRRALALFVEHDRMQRVLREIAEYAHMQSSGPEDSDPLWEIRTMAYDAL